MPVISHTGLNRTVADLTERDALEKKIDGMVVMVNDTTGDSVAGGGVGSYKWNEGSTSWLLIGDDDALSYTATVAAELERQFRIAVALG